jgi:hypothetical protein
MATVPGGIHENQVTDSVIILFNYSNNSFSVASFAFFFFFNSMKVDLFQALTMLFFFWQAEVSFGDVIQPLFSKKSAAEKAWAGMQSNPRSQ